MASYRKNNNDENQFVVNASLSEADKIRQKRDKYGRKRYYTTSGQTSDRTDTHPAKNKIRLSSSYNKYDRYYNSSDPYGYDEDQYYYMEETDSQHASSGRKKSSLSDLLSDQITTKRHGMSLQFLFMVLILLSFGLIMVFSASFPTAYYNHGDGYYFIKKQLIWAGIGVVAMFFTANFNYKNYIHLAKPLLIVSIVLLAAVPLIGMEVNGAKRWLGIGSLSFQPSEFAKIAVIIYFACRMAADGKKIKDLQKGFLPYIGVIGIFALLLMLQPHLSATLLIGATCIILLFIGGADIKHLAGLAMLALLGAIALAIAEPYRLARLATFMNPFEGDMLGDNYQVVQSLYAIGSGGLFGLGFTNSRQKFMYIPEPQNDFIFSIVCEELGFIGALLVMLLFVLLIYQGVKIALNAPDKFSCYLVSGIMILIALEVIINIGVVTSSMPNTGMPLPFFSAGGSNMVFLLASMGIVLNVSRFSKRK